MKLLFLFFVILLTSCSGLLQSYPQEQQKANDKEIQFDLRLETYISDLTIPWSIAFAPDGRIFVTERGGEVRIIQNDILLAEPAYRFTHTNASFVARGESGLLGMALHPDFQNNHYVYIYHTYDHGNGSLSNRVMRFTEKNNQFIEAVVIIDNLPGQTTHDGGRIAFGPDQYLYITVGDAQSREESQNLNSFAGKILRILPDGTIPSDNPFPNSPVYSLGHRNPQGLAWHPATKQLYSSEHGQSAHDEVNRIIKGANYGWPVLQGDELGTSADAVKRLGPGKLMPPLVHSDKVTWAPSGIAFVMEGPWKGHLLVAGLRGERLLTFNIEDDGKAGVVLDSETMLQGELGRIRDVAIGPDGLVYVMTNNRDGRGSPRDGDDRILRFALPK